MRKIFYVALCLALVSWSGSASAGTKIIDLRIDKVVVEPGKDADGYLYPHGSSVVMVEAQRGCAVHGRRAVFISAFREVMLNRFHASTVRQNWYNESGVIYAHRYLFACVD